MTGTPGGDATTDGPAGAVYDSLCTAILDQDGSQIQTLGDELVALLTGPGGGGADLALALALDLIDGWHNLAEEPMEGDDPGAVDAARSSIIEVLVKLGDAFPDPLFADAYEQRALTRGDDEPHLAIQDLRRAVELAATDDERAGYLITLVFAISATGDLDAALVAAEEARRLAVDEETAEMADALQLELLCDLRSPRAGERAVAILSGVMDITTDELGCALMRALIGETARLEEQDLPATREIAAGLRIALDRPAWIPEPLTVSDYACAVAWMDFARDDLSLLESTMAKAPGPFSDPDLEAQAALLRVMVAFTHFDAAGMERELRLAAPLVTRSGKPGIVTAYRLVAEQVSRARSGRSMTDSAAESDALQASYGRRPSAETRLFQDAVDAFSAILNGTERAVSAELRGRFDVWCTQDAHAGVDQFSDAALWALGAAVAMSFAEYEVAGRRMQRARAAKAALGPESVQGQWLDLFLNGLVPSLEGRGDKRTAADATRAIADRYRESGNHLGAFVADAQSALLLLDRDPDAALESAVRALAYRAEQEATLAGSSERSDLRRSERDLVSCALRAADRLQEPRVLAELIEFLRAQEMPIVPDPDDVGGLPLAILLPPAAVGDAQGRSPIGTGAEDAISLPRPRPVRMPWGGDGLPGLGGEGLTGPAVDLVVPVLGTERDTSDSDLEDGPVG